MEIEELVNKYPILYHMAEKNSWNSIKKYGLLSTTALLNLFEVTGNARDVIECQRRPKSVSIHNKKLGTATIRDQIPLREGKFEKGATFQHIPNYFL